MLYEYRRYEAMPGKLPALHARFRDTTTRIWKKHGMRVVAFWEVQVGDAANVLHYMLQWESMEERERKWEAFATDPEWISARAQSEQQGTLVAHVRNELWKPTDYSEQAQKGLV
ncbi:MAG: NIPSNAP family protein [Chloroflexota bacterium]|nr:NIPSNAP family protein [Chloroflexota bacterium]